MVPTDTQSRLEAEQTERDPVSSLN